jgi:hypothetical protein
VITIFPVNDNPYDDPGPMFPASAGGGMIRQLREAGMKFLRPKKPAKKINQESMGTQNPRGFKKKKMTAAAKPENLRKDAKKGKRGPLGEAYTPVSAPNKGIRVAESSFGARLSRFYKEACAREKAPPGREEQVKALKKVPGVDNPYAVSWSQYNKD